MTKLMVRITTEEERELTIAEMCMLDISIDSRYNSGYRQVAYDELINHNFVKKTRWIWRGGYSHQYGLFRHVKERDATQEECAAYYYLKLINSARCFESVNICKACLLAGHCIAYPDVQENALKIVAGKEFYEIEE